MARAPGRLRGSSRSSSTGSPSPTSPGAAAVGWRGRLAAQWPEIKKLEKLSVTGPKADALLLAGWLRSRLRQAGASSTHRAAAELERVAVDGEPVAPPRGGPPTPSDLLSAELDQFGRDPVYEAAVNAAR